MRSVLVSFGALLLAGAALGQSSLSFKLEEHAFNAGGAPAQGVELRSAGYSITLASIGDGVVAGGLSGVAFEVDVGFVAAYPPPAEVAGGGDEIGEAWLAFADDQTLVWPAERSAVTYNLYRDSTGDLFGECAQQDLGGTTTTDSMVPQSGAAYFYLVTAENRLGEEGTKGFSVIGGARAERLGTVCP